MEQGTSGTSTSYYNHTTTTSWSAGAWHYVVWTWRNGADSMYIDGANNHDTLNLMPDSGAGNDEIGRSYFDNSNISGRGPLYFKGTLDEFRCDNAMRNAYWVKLCFQNQQAVQTLVNWTTNGDFTWDNSTSSGIQTGSGTWGSNNYWTLTLGAGTSLVAWPGAGNSATFGGSDGTYTITISGTQNVDSITFLNGVYTLSGGTAVNLGTKTAVNVATGKSAVISTPITGSAGITLYGGGTLTLGGNNTYTGATTISNGTLQLSTNERIPNSSAIVLTNLAASIFNLAGYTETVGSIAGGGATGGNITLGAGGLDCGSDNSSTSYGGLISGSGTLTKSGSGELALSGNEHLWRHHDHKRRDDFRGNARQRKFEQQHRLLRLRGIEPCQ